jgi:rSAM/selenodomain-associated transferase 2
MASRMISVVIPTLEAAETLASTLAALVPAAARGIVRDVVIADGGSSDDTLKIADLAGCTIVKAERGRGLQLAAGAERAKASWILFLHADTVLSEGWDGEAAQFISRAERGASDTAAAFAFGLNDLSWRARLLERIVALRVAVLALPYGDQGLLVPRRLYDKVGGYRPLPLMEDVDLVRRIGRRRLQILRTRAVTSAERYRREGFFQRMARNAACLTLYTVGVPPRLLLKLYG